MKRLITLLSHFLLMSSCSNNVNISANRIHYLYLSEEKQKTMPGKLKKADTIKSMDAASSYRDWIEKGYELFAQAGPTGIRVENLARKLKISKSSFYHHFGDQESFIEMVLEEHYNAAERFAADVRRSKTFVPEFVDLMMKHKSTILFERQLRMYPENLDFRLSSQRAADMVNKETLTLWAEFMEVSSDMNMAKSLYTVIEDLFYQRVSENTFTPAWIYGLLNEMKALVQGLLRRSHPAMKNSAIGR